MFSQPPWIKENIRSPKKLSPMGVRRDKSIRIQHVPLTPFQRYIPWAMVFVLLSIIFMLLAAVLFPGFVFLCPETVIRLPQHCLQLDANVSEIKWMSEHKEFQCSDVPPSSFVVSGRVKNLKYPFFISLTDLLSVGNNDAEIVRLFKGKGLAAKPISGIIQDLLESLIESQSFTKDSAMLDIGCGIGYATFAATSMGISVISVDPILDNMQKLCEGVHFNRAHRLVRLHLSAVSDLPGNVTVYKKPERLEHSAVMKSVTMLASGHNTAVRTKVNAIMVDSLVPESQRVSILKVSVQGWELHALKSAKKLLAKPASEAPVVVYEEDRILLHACNTTRSQIVKFLAKLGFKDCKRKHGHRICHKNSQT